MSGSGGVNFQSIVTITSAANPRIKIPGQTRSLNASFDLCRALCISPLFAFRGDSLDGRLELCCVSFFRSDARFETLCLKVKSAAGMRTLSFSEYFFVFL